MNVVVIQGKENTIRIRSDGLYGDSLWFSVIYYQYFSREVFYLSFSCKSISSLKTNTQGPDCISILIEKATCCFLSVFLFFFFVPHGYFYFNCFGFFLSSIMQDASFLFLVERDRKMNQYFL